MGNKPEKIAVLITSPRVIGILQNLKSGVTKKFAVEEAIENLYNNPETRKVLFNDGENIPDVANETEDKKEEKLQEEKKSVKKFDF